MRIQHRHSVEAARFGCETTAPPSATQSPLLPPPLPRAGRHVPWRHSNLRITVASGRILSTNISNRHDKASRMARGARLASAITSSRRMHSKNNSILDNSYVEFSSKTIKKRETSRKSSHFPSFSFLIVKKKKIKFLSG